MARAAKSFPGADLILPRMFTGIVQKMGRIAAVIPNDFGVRLLIDPQGWQPRGVALALGDSICISGVCLTLAALEGPTLGFDVIAETLRMTTLGQLVPGGRVNLEPSLTADTPMGGHFLQGHVDGVGQVTGLEAGQSEWRIGVTPPAALMDYIIPKGSVAIDGVSLTVASVSRSAFEVALIPTTLEVTTMGSYKVGDKVNLESDILSRTIVHHLRRMAEAAGGRDAGVTRELLRAAGFEKNTEEPAAR